MNACYDSWLPMRLEILHSVSQRDIVVKRIAFGVLLAAAFLFRLSNLDRRPLWEDEAESSINALTILQHGYPSDHYLGIPIFENVLIRESPQDPEYEFRDVSYSDRGIAIYHGWLPLYAIAASFAISGRGPDGPPADLHVRYTQEENRRRTRIARIPSVLLSMLFVVIVYVSGRILCGPEAAWIAASLGAFHNTAIDMSLQARYYQAEVTVGTCCCLMLWLMLTRANWKYYLMGALAFILLFYVHIIAFVAAGIMCAVVLPLQLRGAPARLKKILAFGAIVAAGITPWLFLSGFLRAPRYFPAAAQMIRLGDVLTIVKDNQDFFVLYLVTLGLIFLRGDYRLQFPKLAESLGRIQAVVLFLSLWVLVSYLVFLFLIPAASLAWTRYSYVFWGPGLLLLAVMIGALLRPIPQKRELCAAIAVVCILYGLGLYYSEHDRARDAFAWGSIDNFSSSIENLHLDADTKLYAIPNRHLIASFYTGLPFQSVAPVRKEFLQSYPGPILIAESRAALEAIGLSNGLRPGELEKMAVATGISLSSSEAMRLSESLRSLAVRQTLVGTVKDVVPPVEPVPDFVKDAYERYLVSGRVKVTDAAAVLKTAPVFPLVFRGYEEIRWDEWWQVFFYRFADVSKHWRKNVNYLPVLPAARALVVPDSIWVLYLRPRRNV
jgi:hypothetical protein